MKMDSLMARFVNDHAKREQGWVLRPKRKLECVGADLRQEHIGQVDKQAAAPPLSREPDGFVVCMPFALWRSKCEDWVEVLVATLGTEVCNEGHAMPAGCHATGTVCISANDRQPASRIEVCEVTRPRPIHDAHIRALPFVPDGPLVHGSGGLKQNDSYRYTF
jgi:hypothetical protein